VQNEENCHSLGKEKFSGFSWEKNREFLIDGAFGLT